MWMNSYLCGHPHSFKDGLVQNRGRVQRKEGCLEPTLWPLLSRTQSLGIFLQKAAPGGGLELHSTPPGVPPSVGSEVFQGHKWFRKVFSIPSVCLRGTDWRRFIN